MATTQGQLIHAEKMASLGKMATGIAHEIKNPLNFVTNFSNLNEQLIDELTNELDKKTETTSNGDHEELKSLLDDLKFNSKSILKHGKRADSIVVSLMQHASGGKGQKMQTDINTMLTESIELVSQIAVSRTD
ncbi:MAG: two-component sensor histidine kinase, partial [Bacteroidota bacterium]